MAGRAGQPRTARTHYSSPGSPRGNTFHFRGDRRSDGGSANLGMDLQLRTPNLRTALERMPRTPIQRRLYRPWTSSSRQAEEGGQAAARADRKTCPRSSPASNARSPPQAWCRTVAAPRITRSLRSSRPGASCLTRPGHRRIVWRHEIPDSGISHRNTGSSPRSGTEEGDIPPVSAALEHAAGDFTTLGTDPSFECSSLGHSNSPYPPVSGHAGMSPGRRLLPAPGDRRFLRSSFPVRGLSPVSLLAG